MRSGVKSRRKNIGLGTEYVNEDSSEETEEQKKYDREWT